MEKYSSFREKIVYEHIKFWVVGRNEIFSFSIKEKKKKDLQLTDNQ